MTRLDALLTELHNSPRVDEDDWELKRKDWLQDLEMLFDQVERWLARGIEDGDLKTRRREMELDEPDLGPYRAPALDIYVKRKGSRLIRVEPRGMSIVGVIPRPGHRVVGAQGRVDWICGPRRAILLRSGGGKWHFVETDRPFTSGEVAPELSEDSLADVLGDLFG